MNQIETILAYLTPDKIAFIVQIKPPRLGGRLFIQRLEYEHFPPLPQNDEIQMALLAWEGLGWAVVVIPMAKRHLADPIMAQLGLRLGDGVPTVISTTGIVRFPIDVPNAFTVEHIPGHFAYANNPDQYVKARQAEDTALDRGLAAMQQRWAMMQPGDGMS